MVVVVVVVVVAAAAAAIVAVVIVVVVMGGGRAAKPVFQRLRMALRFSYFLRYCSPHYKRVAPQEAMIHLSRRCPLLNCSGFVKKGDALIVSDSRTAARCIPTSISCTDAPTIVSLV